MRVLFSTTAGSGHFGPLVPFAKACVQAGHTVVMAAPASFADQVRRAGLEHVSFADVPADVMGTVFDRLPQLSREEADRVVITEVFGRLDAQAALPALTAMMGEWAPDIVVRETCEFASMVAAARAGVPHVHVSIGMGQATSGLARILEQPLAELCELAGLPRGRGLELLTSTDTFTSVPEPLDRVATSTTPSPRSNSRQARVWRFSESPGSRSGRLPADWGKPEDPLLYVTFGSVTATLPPFREIYPATLQALAALPVRVLMTVGEALDPATLGPIPANARVERWWPQADAMPLAAGMVGHGGFGTTMTALAAGVPQVLMPLFAYDQFVNADRVAAVGAGHQLLGGPAAVDQLSEAVDQILHQPSYGERARAVAAEMAALPDVAGSPAVLEELAFRRGAGVSR